MKNILVITILALGLFVSCDKKSEIKTPEEMLYSRPWKLSQLYVSEIGGYAEKYLVEEYQEFVFKSDGQFYTDPESENTLYTDFFTSGSWSIINEDQLKINDKTSTFKFNSDSLIVISMDRETYPIHNGIKFIFIH